jgi:hypothetical protein
MWENLDLVRSMYEDWELGDVRSIEWAHPGYVTAQDYRELDDQRVPVLFLIGGVGKTSRVDLAEMPTEVAHVFDIRDGRIAKLDLDSERVLVLEDRSARAKKSGLRIGEMSGEARSKGATLFHLRDGKVTRFVTYFDRDRSFADLGLEGGRAAGHAVLC